MEGIDMIERMAPGSMEWARRCAIGFSFAAEAHRSGDKQRVEAAGVRREGREGGLRVRILSSPSQWWRRSGGRGEKRGFGKHGSSLFEGLGLYRGIGIDLRGFLVFSGGQGPWRNLKSHRDSCFVLFKVLKK